MVRNLVTMHSALASSQPYLGVNFYSVNECMTTINNHYLYLEKTLKSEISEFQTCFLPDLFCVIAKDIYNTMRPFNPDRVNTVKNPVHLSRKTELTPFVKEISADTDTTSGACTQTKWSHMLALWPQSGLKKGKRPM